MEDNLATLSRREMEGLLKNDGRSLQNTLVGQHKAFDGECLRQERGENGSNLPLTHRYMCLQQHPDVLTHMHTHTLLCYTNAVFPTAFKSDTSKSKSDHLRDLLHRPLVIWLGRIITCNFKMIYF